MKPAIHGPYKYRPITQAPKLKWPGGARVALVVVPNLEYFPLDQRIPTARPHAPDVSSWGRRDYGNRVGFFRMADIMAKHGVRGTVALNSMVCDFAPAVIDKCNELGWELMGHAETNTVALNEYKSAQEQKDAIKRVLDRIEKACGRRPTGWLGPHRQETWESLEFFTDEGINYTFDWDSDDQPILMDAGNCKTIVSMPYGAGVSDLQAFQGNGQSSEVFEAMIKDAFDVLYAESTESGRVVGISLHPFIIGLPHRIGSFERGLDYICGHAGVWKATGSEITAEFLKQVKA
jgi:peptidoglycan/xylan/chitin deacetylase (PgdA/CDA1 family)